MTSSTRSKSRHPSEIVACSVQPLDVDMNEPFEIATWNKTKATNILARVRLRDGTVGFGEGATESNSEDLSQAAALKKCAHVARRLLGRPADGFRPLLETIDREAGPRGTVRAALSLAVMDAWGRRAGIPLYALLGGASDRVHSDVTVTILPPKRAQASARRILAMGIRTIKIKIGRDVSEDYERIRAIDSLSRGLRLILDANQGYDAAKSLRLLDRLRRRGIRPALFEQPAAADDWNGLSDVHRHGRVLVAADESVSTREQAWLMARKRSAQVVNIKLMKSGLLEAWEIALICRASGIGLMIGGMVETSLAMAGAAHLAAGVGGFDFVDLDTPLWLKSEPMLGVRIGRKGIYDLSKVRGGIGVTPTTRIVGS